MNKRVKLVNALGRPLILAAILGLPLLTGALLSGAAMAADQAGPTVSKSIAKPLKAAQDAMAAKNYDEAIAKIKEVQAQSGDKTAYDSFVINALLLQAYTGKHDMAAVVSVLASSWQSQYVTAEQKKTWLKAMAGYYYQEKDYGKALDAAEEAVKVGANDADTMGLIAKSDYLLGKYKEAETVQQDIVSRQDKPDEDSLKLLWQFDLKANDNVGAAKTVEKLVAFYPKPEYWANALASLANADTKDAHLQLNVYRLMSDVGVLKRGGDYAEMADIALDEGYPGETEAVLQKAFAANVFTEQRDKDRYQHLLDGAKQRAAADQAALPKSEQDAATAPTGDRLVQVGAAYLSYGQADKAVTLISKGIAKGSLKYPEEATLLLGIAQLRAHNTAEAQRDFEKVGASNNSGYARLGKLWALHAGAKSAA